MKAQKRRVALVTGAGRHGGIGEAVAHRLATDGFDIVIADLGSPTTGPTHPETARWEEMQAIAQEISDLGVRVVPLRLDVTKEASVQKTMQTTEELFGRLDVLVNNAGTIFSPAPVVAMSLDAWQKTLQVNATGTFLCSKYALPLMLQGGTGGRIINISSIAAERPRPYMAAYAASKAAVIALTQAMAQEVAPYGITVNAILPGDIDTPMKRWGMELEAQILGKPYEEVVSGLVGRIPVGRLGLPEDVASLVAFLASEEAAFITGQAYKLTGGRELS